MVLLSSSAVSAAISGGVICAFTFLLFLSGYVLQQRTVRSLQEALRQPPEPLRPIPSHLPRLTNVDVGISRNSNDEIEEIIVGVDTPLEAEQEKDSVAEEASKSVSPDPSQFVTENFDSLAYILSLPEPEDLCSAALFARQQRESSSLPRKPAIVFLYPSVWETSPSPVHVAALTFLRDIQEDFDLVYHPVEISTVWSGVGINSQLLGELQRNRWNYDRALYLKTPGMAMDLFILDQTLRQSQVKKAWAPITASAGHDPDMLFWSRKKGLMMPRGEMRRLTVSAVTSHSNHHAAEMDVEVQAKSAAYVLFDDGELDHRRTEKEWYGGLFELFERERSGICKGRGLLPGERDKVDLRKRST
jgi:hypothetical protein